MAGCGLELVGLLRATAPILANSFGATTVVWLSTSWVVEASLTANEAVPLYTACRAWSPSPEKLVVQAAWGLVQACHGGRLVDVAEILVVFRERQENRGVCSSTGHSPSLRH